MIVYKLVPGLYERELMRKRAFYKLCPKEAEKATPEQRGDDTEHLIFSPDEFMSLSIEFADLRYVIIIFRLLLSMNLIKKFLLLIVH